MSQFGKLCILLNTLKVSIGDGLKTLLPVAGKVSEYFRDFAKTTDVNIIINFFKNIDYKTYAFHIIEKTKDFVYHHHNALLFAFFVIIIDIIIERLIVNRERCLFQTEKDRIAYQYILLEEKKSDLEKVFAEKQCLLDNLQANYKAKQDIYQHIETMVRHSNEVTNIGKDILDQQKQIETQQSTLLQKKLKDIELIMIDGSYNDYNYLAYDGPEWTMKRLKKKAAEMKIPEINWANRTALGYVIRLVEQLSRISDIVEPVYPNGYETEDMELDYDVKKVEEDEDEDVEEKVEEDEDVEEKYSSDPDWVPSAYKTKEEDVDSDVFQDWLINVFYKTKNLTCFFESKKSINIEIMIKINGLNYVFVSQPTSGYFVLKVRI